MLLFAAPPALGANGPYRRAFRLSPPSLDSPGRFGLSLAASGGTLVVGGDPGEDAGSVLLFDAGTGTFLRRVTAPVPSDGDSFGLSFDASNDLIAVAAEGVIHVFSPDGAFIRSLDPSPGNVFYRPQVAVSGGQVLVGDGSGDGLPRAVFLFDGPSGAILNVFRPGPGDCPSEFGTHVALGNGIAFVNADCTDNLQAFHGATGQLLWARVGLQGEEFGQALAADGDKLFVGAPGSHRLEFGAVYLLNGSTGAIVRKYRGKARGSKFGASLAVRERRLLIGAPNSRRGGTAYLFDSATGHQLATFRSGRHQGQFGFAVAMPDRRIAISAPFTLSSPPVTLVFRR